MKCTVCGFTGDSPTHDPLMAPEYCFAHLRDVIRDMVEAGDNMVDLLYALRENPEEEINEIIDEWNKAEAQSEQVLYKKESV